ncbi:MAG: glycosyltransferase family 9 protein, partial [Planctomycetota bacterium]
RSPKKILVIKLWGLGSLALAGRALLSLRKGHPAASITLLTTPECLPLYAENGLYDGTLSLDLDASGSTKDAVGSLATRITERGFDLTVNLEGLSDLAALLAGKSGAPATVGLVGDRGLPEPYTRPVSFLPEGHVEDLFYACARAAGGAEVEPGLVRPVLREKERAFASHLLAGAGVDQYTLLVGLHVGAGPFQRHRAWPVEKFALLAQFLEEESEYRTVFVGGKEDVRSADRCLMLMARPGLSFAGGLSLRETLALLERLHLFIGNDSGPLHLAAALGVATVGLFGPESPARVFRRRDERHAAVYRPRACSPCTSLLGMEQGLCKEGGRCVSDLPVEEVRAVVMDMLDHLSDPEEPPWAAGAVPNHP